MKDERALRLQSPELLLPAISPPENVSKGGEEGVFCGFRSPRCTMDLSIGGGGYNYENAPKFSRMNVWDPYKRLGVTRDASEEEIRGARNFLLEQYAGHEASMESIEAAYEKILMKSFRSGKNPKSILKAD
uniref:J domain-containing protein n=1 Tax=Ananas comosus var. bracteatus TaxID=296719 RepID=A0A6V7QYF2_ANACO